MKGLSTKISKGLYPMSMLTCADNSGAKTLMVINKVGKAGKKRRRAGLGVGDIFIATVKNGTPQYAKKKVRAIVIRQRKPMRRAGGMRLVFEDNAAILVTEVNLPIGTEVKGAMAREVVERYIKLAGIASRVI
jgi:large subunit ribosomal protein L14